MEEYDNAMKNPSFYKIRTHIECSTMKTEKYYWVEPLLTFLGIFATQYKSWLNHADTDSGNSLQA
jgi:hypothetical protein